MKSNNRVLSADEVNPKIVFGVSWIRFNNYIFDVLSYNPLKVVPEPSDISDTYFDYAYMVVTEWLTDFYSKLKEEVNNG